MQKRLLIIDDDQCILDALNMVLTYAGFKVVTAVSATYVFELIESFAPDLILTDYLLRECTGAVVCQRVKSCLQTCHIPVVIMSAFTKASCLTKNCNCDGYIAKPFDMWDLTDKINQVIGQFNQPGYYDSHAICA